MSSRALRKRQAAPADQSGGNHRRSIAPCGNASGGLSASDHWPPSCWALRLCWLRSVPASPGTFLSLGLLRPSQTPIAASTARLSTSRPFVAAAVSPGTPTGRELQASHPIMAPVRRQPGPGNAMPPWWGWTPAHIRHGTPTKRSSRCRLTLQRKAPRGGAAAIGAAMCSYGGDLAHEIITPPPRRGSLWGSVATVTINI
jgi:hypothetical protein